MSVRSEAELWEIRANAAAEAADELGRLSVDLDNALVNYRMGIGCVEGEALHAALLDLKTREAERLRLLSSELAGLSADCRRSAALLAEADDLGRDDIARGRPA